MLSISTLHQSVWAWIPYTIFILGLLPSPVVLFFHLYAKMVCCHPDPGTQPIGRLMKNTAVFLCVLTGTGWSVALCFESVQVTAFPWIKWIRECPPFSSLCTWHQNLKPIFRLMLPRTMMAFHVLPFKKRRQKKIFWRNVFVHTTKVIGVLNNIGPHWLLLLV